LIIMIVALVLAILAPILARLLYFAISRKREYLADASAVRLTRYPEGLASALEKISNSDLDLQKANKITAPMYIVNPLKKKGMKLSDLSSTHPPISERIRILRNLQQGANFKNYQQAFEIVKGKKSDLIPSSALNDPSSISIIQPLVTQQTFEEMKTAKREVGDVLMKLNDFKFVNCTCGLKIKIPPAFKQSSFKCPKCGTVHQI